MTRTATACYLLTASAFVLAALLLLSFQGRFTPPTAPASAALVTSAGNYSFLTAFLGAGDEHLFVLDDAQHKLLVYDLVRRQKQINLLTAEDLDALFNALAGAKPPTPEQRPPR